MNTVIIILFLSVIIGMPILLSQIKKGNVVSKSDPKYKGSVFPNL